MPKHLYKSVEIVYIIRVESQKLSQLSVFKFVNKNYIATKAWLKEMLEGNVSNEVREDRTVDLLNCQALSD